MTEGNDVEVYLSRLESLRPDLIQRVKSSSRNDLCHFEERLVRFTLSRVYERARVTEYYGGARKRGNKTKKKKGRETENR